MNIIKKHLKKISYDIKRKKNSKTILYTWIYNWYFINHISYKINFNHLNNLKK